MGVPVKSLQYRVPNFLSFRESGGKETLALEPQNSRFHIQNPNKGPGFLNQVHLLGGNIRAFIIGTGFWAILYYNSKKEPSK